MALLQWLLSHGADPDGGGLATSAPKPITAALQLKDARYLGQLLANGAASNVCAVPGKSLLSSALELRHADHLELLVQYGADLDAVHENDSTHRTHGVSDSHDQTIRQTISDFPAGSSRVALKTAMAKGLAARRHLVVLTLGARAVPALSRDVLQLICQHASLMP